ncbi:hypothetical protein SLUN_38975 (plasmid) [Streptomyces lunaelactis]|uniref:Uncharacterized protein n=1 Tax=Streptomyces lunaelactis TaxID=1535768 RepID=A0A2R4TFV6_9ACTN|nr:hypothetical protein [Streptomyces lunaelactis]AVZ78015.1 hypothetical protein SLUN_38975 [Streptomyces lunaelactis]NUK84960.1 hypothetical protein [Streptomyces lunaelactis]
MPSSFTEQMHRRNEHYWDEQSGRRRRREEAMSKAKAALETFGTSDAEDLSRAHGELAQALTDLLTEFERGAV